MRPSGRHKAHIRVFNGGSGNATALLNQYSVNNGVVFSVPDNSLAIADPVTPANNFTGQLINTATGLFNKLTYTGASARTAMVNGVLQTFAANVPRIQVVNGVASYLSEPTASNIAIQCRDMTQAAWVKANTTAALTATGIDNAVNSASTITATAASATVLQTITQVATQDVASFWLRRRTGSGTVNITQDGVTWFPVALTSAWQRFPVASATLTNPVIGVQIITSGDAVDVDYTQLEAGGIMTSNILTTTVSVTRAADSLSIGSGLFNLTAAATLYTQANFAGGPTVNATSRAMACYSDGTNSNRVLLYNLGGAPGFFTAVGGVTQNQNSDAGSAIGANSFKQALAFAAGDFAFVVNARAPITAVGSVPTANIVHIGTDLNGLAANGGLSVFMFAGQRISNAQLQALTT